MENPVKKLTLSVCLFFLLSQSSSVLSSTSSPSDDGWSYNQALTTKWDHKALSDLQKRIEQKEFKKITSVLVAHQQNQTGTYSSIFYKLNHDSLTSRGEK